MTELEIRLEDNVYKVKSEGFYIEFPGGSKGNQKTLIIFLRSFKKHAKGRHGLFSQEQIAKAIPDYQGVTQQSIQDHERRFEECGKDIQSYLLQKRKVDQEVVSAIAEQLEKDLMAENIELAARVNEKLSRKDINDMNIAAGLEQIPVAGLRKTLRRQMEQGQIRYKEEYLLERSFLALQAQEEKLKQEARTLLARAEIEVGEQEEVMKAATVPDYQLKALCTIDGQITELPVMLKTMCVCLRLYGHGLSLSALGQCFGVDKTTILRWIIGLAIGLYPIIWSWIKLKVKGHIVHIDEKWIKIKGKWHYWFVALDQATGLPIWQELMPGNSQWHCQWVLIGLKCADYKVSGIVTDGWKGYLSAIVQVFNGLVTHQLCLFHHQQNVTKFVRDHFTDEKERQSRKKAMKRLFQTKDKRTVKNRLAKLADKAEALGIIDWVKSVTQILPLLLPAVGSRRLPSTNNAIERFFRAFNQFYKTRNGFFSLPSANRQLMLFSVFYLFSQRENGLSPIESIMPQASRMPLYKLINSPLACLGIFGIEASQNQALAEKYLKHAA